MKIKAIILKNFRQYGYEIIKFPSRGIIGIVGKNGKGKSTIFNSLGWVFYGKIKDVLKEDIKNTDAGKREECYVIVFFEYQGETYVIKRHLTKKDECFLKKTAGGPPLATGTSDLTRYITEKFFKMDYQSFCACYYAQQDDFDALSKMTPAKRRETLTRLLRINKIDKAVEKAKDEIKEHENKVEKFEHVLKKEENLVNNIQSANESIAGFQKELQISNEQIVTLQAKYDELVAERLKGDTLNERFLELKENYIKHLQQLKQLEERELVNHQHNLTELSASASRFKEIESSIHQYNSLVKEAEEMNQQKSLYQEKVTLAKQLQEIKVEADGFKTEYRTLQEGIQNEETLRQSLQVVMDKKESLVNTMQELQSTVQEKEFEIRSLREKMNQLEETKKKFETLGSDSPCPVCERALGEHFGNTMDHIASEQTPIVEQGKELQEAKHALIKEGEGKRKEYDVCVQEEQRLVTQLLEIDKKKERMQFIQDQMNRISTKYKQLLPRYQELQSVSFDTQAYQSLTLQVQQVKGLHDEALSIQSASEKIPAVEEKIVKTKQEIEGLKETLLEIENQVKSLNFDETAYKTLTAQVEEAQRILQAEKDKVKDFSHSIELKEVEITNWKKQLEEIKQARLEIVELKNRIAYLLTMIHTYLQPYKLDIISRLVPDLSRIMSEDMERVTDGYYEQVELDPDFNVYIYRLGDKKPLTFFSGGEQKLAALLQLLGVSHLISEQTGQAAFEMVAMDEVLGSFDDERQASTIEQLRNLNDIFPQLLMVAHQELVKDMFDYTLVVSTDEKRHSQTQWTKEWDDSEIQELIEPYIAS